MCRSVSTISAISLLIFSMRLSKSTWNIPSNLQEKKIRSQEVCRSVSWIDYWGLKSFFFFLHCPTWRHCSWGWSWKGKYVMQLTCGGADDPSSSLEESFSWCSCCWNCFHCSSSLSMWSWQLSFTLNRSAWTSSNPPR
jgi:hypothetical protein